MGGVCVRVCVCVGGQGLSEFVEGSVHSTTHKSDKSFCAFGLIIRLTAFRISLSISKCQFYNLFLGMLYSRKSVIALICSWILYIGFCTLSEYCWCGPIVGQRWNSLLYNQWVATPYGSHLSRTFS